MNCKCEEIVSINGQGALDYAKEHLEEVWLDPVNWCTKYVCPVTGKCWVLDYPDSAAHGGGTPQLRLIACD